MFCSEKIIAIYKACDASALYGDLMLAFIAIAIGVGLLFIFTPKAR